MPQIASPHPSMQERLEIHLLDPGKTRYGDCVLCRFGEVRVLIDGGHPGDYAGKNGHRSIPEQLSGLLGQDPDALRVDLLVITHTHDDHFGCLPRLINTDRLVADWAIVADPDLGWGRLGPQPDAPVDIRIRQLQEILRGDSYIPGEELSSADGLELADAVNQEAEYRAMVQKLGATGKVCTFLGRDPQTGKFDQDLQNLLDHFWALGVQIDILGPSGTQLAACSQQIQETLSSAAQAGQDTLRKKVGSDTISLLDTLNLDSGTGSRAGNFVNLQSLVTLFTYAGRKFLFSGDMQLENPSATRGGAAVSPRISSELRQLRDTIGGKAPFDFVKLGHHGSYNAFSERILALYGTETVLFGITTGEVSPTHPDPKVTLPILRAHQGEIQWARTDYNRLCSFRFTDKGVTYDLEQGDINNSLNNEADLKSADFVGSQGTRRATPFVPASEALNQVLATGRPEKPGPRFKMEIPLSLSVSLELTLGETPRFPVAETGRGQEQAAFSEPKLTESNLPPKVSPGGSDNHTPSTPAKLFEAAPGRDISRLLFVTSSKALEHTIGKTETAQAVDSIKAKGAKVLDLAGLPDSTVAVYAVRARLLQDGGIEGVVLLGGHDVIPHQRFDVLPPNLRSQVKTFQDADNFIVWSDAAYGRRADTSLQDVPVSRIPDGHLSDLVFRALQAPKTRQPAQWAGLRSKMRPFADPVFKSVSGAPMLTCPTVMFSQFPPPRPGLFQLDAEHLYLMLHGDDTRSNFFWGERGPGDYPIAFSIENIRETPGLIIFTGCCWGALTTTSRACDVVPGQAVGVKQPETSIALRFLQNGALAFLGCTGSHYSPPPGPPLFAGGAMHDAFFSSLPKASGPAEALLMAKKAYLGAMPHGQTDLFNIAVEYKTLHEYSCLGLGW